ncbi:MAG: hypothetical protein ABFD75_00060 [Smithella sp.]
MVNRQYKGVINYFVNYTSIFSLTPWRNSIRLFHEEGYKIRVYQYADERISKHPTDLEDKYTLVEIHYPVAAKYILFVIKSFFRAFRHIGLKKLSTLGDGIDSLFRNYYFIAACLLKNKCGEHEVFIGGDPGSLIAAHALSKRKKGILIYWSLELYIEKDIDNFGLKIIKRAERKCNRQALCTVDFGNIRCKVLQEENRLDPTTMISIPNSQIGRGEIVRNYYFNDKFNIPRNKVVILHAGGLFTPFIRVKDIFQSVREWPDDYILVLHTHQRPYPGCGFSIPEEYLNKKVFLNDDPVPFDQLDTIYSSCDIGIMVHGPLGTDFDKNLYYSDLSVGKIFHHVKVGVPLIIRNLPGYPELIESRQAGVCIESSSDILPAIQKIMSNHEQYKMNALKLHDEYRFELYHAQLSEKISAVSAG